LSYTSTTFKKGIESLLFPKIKNKKNISHLVEFGSGRREKISNDFLPDYILNEMEKIVKILARNLSSKSVPFSSSKVA
jgi:hypothetical protein